MKKEITKSSYNQKLVSNIQKQIVSEQARRKESLNEALKKLKKPIELGSGKKGVYFVDKVGFDSNGNWSYMVSRGSNKAKKIQHQGEWSEKIRKDSSEKEILNSKVAQGIIDYYEKYIKEEVVKEAINFSKQQLDHLRKGYAPLKRINPASPSYKKLEKVLNNLGPAGLKQIADANINFISMLAKNRIKFKKQNENINESLKNMTLNEGADWILLSSIGMMIDSYRGHFVTTDTSKAEGDIEFGTKEWKQLAKKLNSKDKKIVASIIKNEELGEEVNEAKSDFVARHSGTTITIKGARKNYSDDELEKLYDLLGNMLKKQKIKTKSAVITAETVNEEKVYIDWMGPKTGFKTKREKFNSVSAAEKWGKKNLNDDEFHPFNSDMIHYIMDESINEPINEASIWFNQQRAEPFFKKIGLKVPKNGDIIWKGKKAGTVDNFNGIITYDPKLIKLFWDNRSEYDFGVWNPKEKAPNVKESVNEGTSMDAGKKLKIYNSLNKGDLIDITYDSTVRKDAKNTFVVSKGKTKVGKQRVERISLQIKDKRTVKFYLYQRGGNVTLAMGDMAAMITDMQPHTGESVNTTSLKHYKKLKNQGTDVKLSTKADLNKKKVNEASNEPDVIKQIRKVVDDQQNAKIKDPKSGKKIRMPLYTASAIIQVYDSINGSNQRKFVESGLVKMSNIAMKMVKK